MSAQGFLSERTQPVTLTYTTAVSSFAETSGTVDLQAYNADSCLIVGTVMAATGAGLSMTAIGGDSTSALGGYCVAAGSTSSLLTVASTVIGKSILLDVKNSRHRYVGAKATGLGAGLYLVQAYPYDSKKQPVPLTTTASLASTASGTGFYRSVSPTTA